VLISKTGIAFLEKNNDEVAVRILVMGADDGGANPLREADW